MDDHDEFHCPAAMNDETCEIMEECHENGFDGNITCTKNVYDYCTGDGSYDHDVCGGFLQEINEKCYDDDGNEEVCGDSLLYAAFDYENDNNASEFIDAFMDVYGGWLEEINKYAILKVTPFEDVYHITEENKSNSYLVDLEFSNLNVSRDLGYHWIISYIDMVWFKSG